MVLIYFIVGLLNIFSQHHNYGIKIEDPHIDIRVRRSIENAVKPEDFYIRNNLEKNEKTDVLKSDVSKREKRYAYYKKTRITYNDVLKYSTNNNNNSENQTLKNRYDIFNPNYNFLNTTRNNQNNNTGVKNGNTINSRPLIRSYPYGYPAGYEPRTNKATGYNVVTATPGYRNQNDNTPDYYNYQNPNGPNFGGYSGYNANKLGYETVTPIYYNTSGYYNTTGYYNPPGYYNSPGNHNPPVAYEPRSSPNPSNYYNSALAPYPPTYTQKPINKQFSSTNNSGIHNLPYNNNFNNIPVPFNNDNLPQYAINFNNGTTVTNSTYMAKIVANNTSEPPRNDYIFPSINDYIVPSNNTNVSPTNNNNEFPNNNNNFLPNNNTNVTPIKVNSTVTTTTARTLSGCVICNIPCPQFMRRFGKFCMPDDDDDYQES